MNISQNGVNFIKRFEGVRLSPYKAVPTEKYLTVGFGHYGIDVKAGVKITEAQAEALLKKDLQKFVNGVNACLKVSVNQNQFDALVSFHFNTGALPTSDLLKKVNAKDFAGASREFARWNKSGGKVIQGLINRRNQEIALFLKPVPAPKPAPKPVAKPVPVSAIKTVGKIKIVNLKNFTYIYDKPSASAKAIGEAKLGAVFPISGSVPNYYEVVYNGKRSYISAKFCTRV
jgi:GH24 family phage-related lysozyme (muramidase)